MKITKRQLTQIIKENLLLEFNPAWFITTKGKALTSFLFAFLASNQADMSKAAESIANYFDDCDEMLDEVKELISSDGLRSTLIKYGMPILDAVAADELKIATLEKNLIDDILTEKVVGCGDEVINAIKKLAFMLAEQIVKEGKYNDYQIVKDFKNNKYDYLIA